MDLNTGGPAFPKGVIAFEPRESDLSKRNEMLGDGMTLRDYFAAKALVALVTKGDAHFTEFEWAETGSEEYAEAAYRFADAMLKARDAVQQKATETPVQLLGLTVRAEGELLDGGVRTVEELCLKSANDLLRLPRLGRVSLKNIRERLAAHNLKLRGD